MNRIITLSLISLLFISIFVIPSKQDYEQEDPQHPGFFDQWFEWKKNENGEIPAGRFEKWNAHDMSMMATWSRRAGENPIVDVKELGPESVSGRTRALLIHPDNDKEIFAGGISGGLWHSVDGGKSWKPINDHQSSLMVSSITMNPFNHNEIYYGTGEMRANSAKVNGDGIFKSTDGGKTFTQLPGASSSHLDQVWTIKHSILDSSTVYVGTNSGGLYYTKNSGKTWSKHSASAGAITDIEQFEDGTILCGRTSNGVYRIKPGLDGFSKLSLPGFTSTGRVEIEKCQKYPNVVYVALEGTSTHKVYKSRNTGKTWEYMSTAPAGNSYSRYCFDLAVHPNDSIKLMVSALSLRWSYDGAKTWKTGRVGHADHHSHAYFSGGDRNDILLGSDGGVTLHNFTNSNTATRISDGYKVTQFYAGNYGPEGDTWIAGTQDNGTHRNTFGLHKKVFGGDGGYSHWSLQDINLAYWSTQKGNTYRSTNFSSSFPTTKTITNSTMIGEGVSFINAFHMNKYDGKKVYYRTSKGLWRSTNMGTNWDKISTTTGILSITSSLEEDPVVYLGRSGSQFVRIDSSVTNPTQVSLSKNRPSNAGSGTVLEIEIHPENKNTVFLSYSNNSNNPRIWKVENCDSADKLKWTNVSGNLPKGLPVNDMALHPQAPDSIMFAATDFGLYYTTDSGNTWQKEMRVPSVAIFKIEMRASDNHAFLFTHGRGVWRLSTAKLEWNTSLNPANDIKFTVYPNPVEKGTLKVSIENRGQNYSYRLFDINGRVALENKSAESKLALDVTNLNSGVYFLEIASGSKKKVEKVSILN